MIPLKSDNPLLTFPVMNVLLIVTNVLVFLYELSLSPRAGNRLIFEFGLIPARFDTLIEPTRHAHGALGATVLPLLTCMFLHAGWLHLLGNMLFLWVFGGSVEDILRLGLLLRTSIGDEVVPWANEVGRRYLFKPTCQRNSLNLQTSILMIFA